MSTSSYPFSPGTFIARIRHTITEFQMIQPRESILIGVSGGPDSVALMHVLMEISKTYSTRLAVAHLNHGLRGKESDGDATFVESLARQSGLLFYGEKINLQNMAPYRHLSLEEAGRAARYDFFNHVAESHGYQKIALGHHADDSAELILLNLIRGSGPSGLKGIPAARGNIIRPLIHVSRHSILSYLNHYQLPYRNDSSNQDERFIRNKIRHQLLPFLKQHFNPKMDRALIQLGTLLSDEENWFAASIDQMMEPCIAAEDSHQIRLYAAALRNFHVAIQRRIIRRAIFRIKGNLRRISFAHVEAVLAQLRSGRQSASLHLPDRIRIDKRANILQIAQEKKSLRCGRHFEKTRADDGWEHMVTEPEAFEKPWIIPEIGMGVTLKKIGRKDLPEIQGFSEHTAVFDADRIRFPLSIRNYRSGDYFVPLGMTGRQSLKKFFINNKIPPQQRNQFPLLISENTIIWVIGKRISDLAKITPNTQTILWVKSFWLQKNQKKR